MTAASLRPTQCRCQTACMHATGLTWPEGLEAEKATCGRGFCSPSASPTMACTSTTTNSSYLPVPPHGHGHPPNPLELSESTLYSPAQPLAPEALPGLLVPLHGKLGSLLGDVAGCYLARLPPGHWLKGSPCITVTHDLKEVMSSHTYHPLCYALASKADAHCYGACPLSPGWSGVLTAKSQDAWTASPKTKVYPRKLTVSSASPGCRPQASHSAAFCMSAKLCKSDSAKLGMRHVGNTGSCATYAAE